MQHTHTHTHMPMRRTCGVGLLEKREDLVAQRIDEAAAHRLHCAHLEVRGGHRGVPLRAPPPARHRMLLARAYDGCAARRRDDGPGREEDAPLSARLAQPGLAQPGLAHAFRRKLEARRARGRGGELGGQCGEVRW